MRRSEKINIDYIFDLYRDLKKSGVEFYIDIENEKEAQKIKSFLEGRKARKIFNRILYVILTHRYNDSLYQKVVGFSDVAEMRFNKFLGNVRIYCKEIKSQGKKVIMVSLLYKNQKAIKDSANTKSAVERISKYNYTLSE